MKEIKQWFYTLSIYDNFVKRLDLNLITEMKIVEAVSSQLEDVVTFTYNLDGAADKM